MRELIRNAWLGWQSYTDNGKMAALLLIALLLLWLGRKEIRKPYHTLVLYTTVMTFACICPFTAAVLMGYQTRFYDYQWIWELVPVTIVIALTGTLLWTELMKKYEKQRYAGWKRIGITALLIALIYLCGRMGNPVWDADEEVRKREETAKVLEIITENGKNTDINLWAPQGVMEYVRVLDGNIRLPYGRNMWDPALNGYAYDTYGEKETMLYRWMANAEETGEGDAVIETAMDMARELGVNHILLPGNLQPEVLAELEQYLGISAEKLEGYYWFRMES